MPSLTPCGAFSQRSAEDLESVCLCACSVLPSLEDDRTRAR